MLDWHNCSLYFTLNCTAVSVNDQAIQFCISVAHVNARWKGGVWVTLEWEPDWQSRQTVGFGRSRLGTLSKVQPGTSFWLPPRWQSPDLTSARQSCPSHLSHSQSPKIAGDIHGGVPEYPVMMWVTQWGCLDLISDFFFFLLLFLCHNAAKQTPNAHRHSCHQVTEQMHSTQA